MKKIVPLVITLLLYLVLSNHAISQENNNLDLTSNTALIIIDIQNFYFPEGALPLYEPEKAAENAKKVLDFYRKNKMLVIHVKHNASSGAEIHDLVKPLDGEKVVSKDKANAFVGTDLLEFLKANNITNLTLCGMQTHMCLEAATRAASDYGFECIVIEDACTTRDLKHGDEIVKAKDVHYSTLSTLKDTYAEIETTANFVNALK
ncbi:cysteine hydrolase family protein [Bacteroidota bacterium]